MIYTCNFLFKPRTRILKNSYTGTKSLELSREYPNYLCVIGITQNNIMKRSINYGFSNLMFLKRLYGL